MERLLTPLEVSERTGLAVQTLAKKRCTGIGSPPFVRIGRSVRYPEADFEAWLASFPLRRSTSDVNSG